MDGRLVFLCAFLKSHEWLDELFFPELLLKWGQQYITPFTGRFFSPPLDPGHPVQLQLQRSLLSCLQPSSLFVSFLQLCCFFLKPLKFLYSPFLPFFSPSVNPGSTVSASSCVLGFDSPLESPPPIKSWFECSLPVALMDVGMFFICRKNTCFVRTGWAFFSAAGVLSWGGHICSCFNNVRGEVI